MKTLLEYAFFHAWIELKDERYPASDALGILIVPVSLYIAGLVILFGDFIHINLFKKVADVWPNICDHCKYFKPEHGLALIIGIFTIVWIYFHFEKQDKCAKISIRFSSSTESEMKVGYWAKYFLCSAVLFSASLQLLIFTH
jgi:hypothetical protein